MVEENVEGEEVLGDTSPKRNGLKKKKSKRKSHSSHRPPDPPASREIRLLSDQENGYSQFNSSDGKTYTGTDTVTEYDNVVELGSNHSERDATKSSYLATSDDPFAARGT